MRDATKNQAPTTDAPAGSDVIEELRVATIEEVLERDRPAPCRMNQLMKARLSDGVNRVLRRAIEIAQRFDETEELDVIELRRAAEEIRSLKAMLGLPARSVPATARTGPELRIVADSRKPVKKTRPASSSGA